MEAAAQSVIGLTFGVIGGRAAATYFTNYLGSGRATIARSAIAPVRRGWRLDTSTVLREDG